MEGAKGMTYIGVLRLAVVGTQPIRIGHRGCGGHRGMTYMGVLCLALVGTQGNSPQFDNSLVMVTIIVQKNSIALQ